MDSDELLTEEDLIKPDPASLRSKERERGRMFACSRVAF